MAEFVGSVANHRQAELCMTEMDMAKARGDYASAARWADEAATFEEQALTTIPVDRPRTRSMIDLSARSLRERAETYRQRDTPDEPLFAGTPGHPVTHAELTAAFRQRTASPAEPAGSLPIDD